MVRKRTRKHTPLAYRRARAQTHLLSCAHERVTAKCKGQKVMRQQEYASERREQTSYERKEAEWSRADIANAKKGDGGGGGGGLDGWCAKQSLN